MSGSESLHPSSGHIYPDSTAFLRPACAEIAGGRIEVFELQEALETYLHSIPSANKVQVIVGSLGYRKLLLELASKLDTSNALALLDALHRDEQRLAALLISIFDSEAEEDVVLRLEGDSAQSFLDVVQDAVDRELLEPEENKKAQRIIRKLSEASDRLPSSLFIEGVVERDVHPTFGGGFSDVYRASYDKKPVALKRLRYFLQGADLRRLNLKFCREALVWKDLRHPYILPFIGIDRDSFPSSLCMVSPWMEHGTVLSYIKENGPSKVDKLLFEIAQGLQYLHSHAIVHGDLRGANILVSEDWSACLSDFGLSSFSDATTSMHTSTRAGSIYWMAPELIAPARFGCKFSRTQASDVYAFACVCVELYTGRPPFSDAAEASALFAVVNGERPARPSGMPDTLWRLVSECWSENPRTRPSSTVVAQTTTFPISGQPKTPPSGSSASSVSSADSHDHLHIDAPKLVAARSPEDSRKEIQLQQQQRPGIEEKLTPKRNRMESPPRADQVVSDTDAVVSEARSEAQRVVFPKEDHRLFRQCNDAREYAQLLLDAVREPVSDEQADIVALLQEKCTSSQKFLVSQIPWATEGAERSRVGRDSAASAADVTATLEEKLLADLLDANERIIEASTLYDDFEPKRRRELVDTKKAELDVSAVPFEATEPPQPPLLEQETEKTVARSVAEPSVDRVEEPSLPPEGVTFTAVAVSSHIADPDDPDDISVKRDEIVQVLDRVGKWWFVQTGDGRSGIVPSSHFTIVESHSVPFEATEPPQPPLLEQETEKTVDSEAEPSVDRVEEPPLPLEGATFTAVAVSSHEADPDDPDDISITRDETVQILDRVGKWLSIKRDKIVQVLDRVGKWWSVQTGDGRSGIVSTKSQSALGRKCRFRAGRKCRFKAGRQCRFKAEALNSLDAADESEDHLSFEVGEILDILDDSGDWWCARKTSGGTVQ
ncbi:hypothetical protein FB45DRAFT_180933 [Roridomyces roridus]|uniref:mitogen-activated protein kinase kinase kinase n=1 Tax=Roridomyces roridus TaxID=1738132 RepID=A0AAD7CE76_9AGAR|nr:hypothetical protein FB45DRAFT_180933 [Roridomyces roridus]